MRQLIAYAALFRFGGNDKFSINDCPYSHSRAFGH
jgi:hypothetical protein